MGPVIAGVIGRKKFAYDLWGATVNMACHLERLGEAGTVLVSETAHQRLQSSYRFEAVQISDRKLRYKLKLIRLFEKAGTIQEQLLEPKAFAARDGRRRTLKI